MSWQLEKYSTIDLFWLTVPFVRRVKQNPPLPHVPVNCCRGQVSLLPFSLNVQAAATAASATRSKESEKAGCSILSTQISLSAARSAHLIQSSGYSNSGGRERLNSFVGSSTSCCRGGKWFFFIHQNKRAPHSSASECRTINCMCWQIYRSERRKKPREREEDNVPGHVAGNCCSSLRSLSSPCRESVVCAFSALYIRCTWNAQLAPCMYV